MPATAWLIASSSSAPVSRLTAADGLTAISAMGASTHSSITKHITACIFCHTECFFILSSLLHAVPAPSVDAMPRHIRHITAKGGDM